MRNFEITKREVLASISIIAVMILVGILISAKITECQMDRNEVYNKAVKIDSQEMFSYGMRTNVGNAFIYGTLQAVDPVSIKFCDEENANLCALVKHNEALRKGEANAES
jgi:hypothetical protein